MASAVGHFNKYQKHTLICVLCLDVYKQPKLLPCHHTFCKRCLEKLVATGPQCRRFPCPSCRRETDLPSGGVAGFQDNFYIDPDGLEKARYGLLCTVHPSRELELFCHYCSKPICLKCKITNHGAHFTSDLQSAAVPAVEEKQSVGHKRDALKQAILNREAILKAAAEKFREEAMASLDKITDEIAQNLTVSWVKTVCRPVLRFKTMNADALQRMRDFVGNAVKMEMAVSAPEVMVMEQLRCRDDPATDIYQVCPLTNENVIVSYEPGVAHNGASSEATCEEFDKNGRRVDTLKCHGAGINSVVRRKNGAYMYLAPGAGGLETFGKKCESDMNRYLKLDNSLVGKATVWEVYIISEFPLQMKQKGAFTIKCAAHRAFDVSASEQQFVVLEEGKAPDLQRRVQMYRRPKADAIATYIPPLTPFQPSDVCFYTLGGQEVLLVADELNDAIHVVNVQDGRLSFARYLSPGCPLLVQPTALNTDMRGRLWVACRGGRILTCTPISALAGN